MAKSRDRKRPAVGKNRKGVNQLGREVLLFFRQNPGRHFNYKQVAAGLGVVKEAPRQQLRALILSLAQQGMLEESEPGKFGISSASATVTGIADATSSGTIYVIQENEGSDILIPRQFTKGALNGDLVRVQLWNTSDDEKPKGEIVEIIKRHKTEFPGRIELHKQVCFFVPDNLRSISDVYIPTSHTNGAKHGDKVIVKITEWEKGGKNPVGEVIKILGKSGEHNAEIHAIMAEFDLPFCFPEEVENESKKISLKINEDEIKKRRDFRPINTFTIDPEDAKDFDDALSVRQVDHERWEIGVHIADVSHFVQPGSILDEEAMQRATSVYLVDRVIPMLPEVLSNQICSLVPNEDRLCYSAVFTLDNEAKIHDEWFGRTIIHSKHRFSYEQAQKVIETGQGPMSFEIGILQQLALSLREARFRRGAIAFEKPEVKFRLGEDGVPVGVFFKVMKDSNKLIEDFMLLANRRVAERIHQLRTKEEPANQKTKKDGKNDRIPFVYRIHDHPNPEKLQEFSKFVSRFGYQLKTQNRQVISQSMNKLLRESSGKKEEGIIEQLALRTMAKAVYSTHNIGHYGLAFDHYTHFTSPIRRYPDVLAHRLLEYYLHVPDAEKESHPLGQLVKDKELLEDFCKHSSDQEKLASDAERASIKYKQIEFLSARIGQEFEGIISGITEYGMYVEIIENLCEGMIRARDLTDDTYVFDSEEYCYRGRRKQITYQLGDKVKIRIKRCDLLKKQVDFLLLGKIEKQEHH